jgi:hypothetical protein
MATRGNGRPAPKPIPGKAVVRAGDLGELLGVPQSAIDAEVKSGRLRVARVSGEGLVLGEWIHSWLKATAG